LAFPHTDSPASDVRRVVVTGAGIVSPMGMDFAENAAGFRAGRAAFSPVTLFDVSRQRTGSAGQVNLPDRMGALPGMDRGTRLAWLAAREALASAGLNGGRMPLVIGTSAAAMPIGEDYYRAAHVMETRRRHQLQRVEAYQVQRQMSDMARHLNVDGRIRIVSNACASGANAIGQAFHLVRSGRAERVLAGGYDALCQLVFAGFDALQALSPSGIPRPFDAARDGLALGEGAGFVVVETADAAKTRGARIIAEITGYGAATDVHHLTQPHPEGDAALVTMNAACAMAGVSPEQIDYINSHGTGTPLNDVAEGNAIRRWAGDAVSRIRVSSTKSAIGHLLGGAGAVESVICLMALEGQWLPASLHVREPDPVCVFDLVREPRAALVRRVLTNSFGFGGANATLIFEKEDAP
jgi:3-oxoacyl-[acyl-carrier-protein] synthase II